MEEPISKQKGMFVRVDALCPSQQFFSNFWTFSWAELVISSENKMS